MSQNNKPSQANLRPVMNPTFEKWEVQRAKIAIGWHHVVNGIKWVGRYLLRNPFAIKKTDEPRVSPLKVLLRMGLSWAIFLPTVTIVTAIVMVVQGTHPAPPPAVLDPNSRGCYFESISFASADGAKLSAWMVPALDAHRIVIEKDKVLKSRRPAIVLVHDFGQSPQQMLALVKPLHDEGVNVFVLALRGCGRDRTAGATFGIKESEDVAAAVEVLRQTRFVDPNRIAVAGIGSGAGSSPVGLTRTAWTICRSSGVGSGRGTPYDRWVVNCGSAPSGMLVGRYLKYSRAFSRSVPTMASTSTPCELSSRDVVAICASARLQNGQYSPGNRPSRRGDFPR